MAIDAELVADLIDRLQHGVLYVSGNRRLTTPSVVCRLSSVICHRRMTNQINQIARSILTRPVSCPHPLQYHTSIHILIFGTFGLLRGPRRPALVSRGD